MTTSGHPAPTVVSIDTAKEFGQLREEWTGFHGGTAAPAPFDSHRWLHAWWRASEQVGAKRAHRILIARSGGRIVGALPLQFERHTIRRLPVKKASPMGSGWGASSLLVSPDAAAIASMALVDACHDRSLPRWQMLHIAHWRGERPAQECFLRSLQARGIRTREIRVAEPFLALDEDWPTFLARSSRNFRRTVKRKLQAMRDAALEPRHWRNPTPDVLISTIGAVSGRSWQGSRGLSVLATPFGRAFYELMAGEHGEFDVELSVLQHEGRPVAFLLGFVAHGVYHAFETGFDPRWAEQSPGLVLHFLALERLHNERVREFDFGHAHGYKARFDPALRETSEIRAFRSVALSRIDQAFALVEAWLARSAARRTAPILAPETN